jgi:hypothetical protein
MRRFKMKNYFLPGKLTAALEAFQEKLVSVDIHVLFLISSLVEVGPAAGDWAEKGPLFGVNSEMIK